jgi:hypothetical protein
MTADRTDSAGSAITRRGPQLASTIGAADIRPLIRTSRSTRVYVVLDGANNRYDLLMEDRVEEIVLGEPDEALFQVEAEFIERSPAEFAMLVNGDEIDRALIDSDPFVQRAEANYHRSGH